MAFADYFPLPEKWIPRGLRSKPCRHFMPDGSPMYGIVAEYDTPAAVYHAAEKVRDAGFKAWDLHSPFPMHGAEHAMGFERTKLPLIVGAVALSGAAAGYLMQWWMSAVAYPVNVQGKPPGAWEPFVPITFEVGVLSAAFTALFGMLAMNGLPRFHHPLFKSERFLAASDDKFFIAIEAQDEKFNPDGVRRLLESTGASRVDTIGAE